jgi:hypothetical protein
MGKIDEMAAARKEEELRAARREDEWAARKSERALATGSRIELIEGGSGSELRVRPMGFFAALNGFDRPSFFGLVPLCAPGVILFAAAHDLLRAESSFAAAALPLVYFYLLYRIARWFVGTTPLRICVTPKGHAAFWHRSVKSDRPAWAGPKESLQVGLIPFERRNVKTGRAERRLGWTEVFFLLPGKPLRRAGPAYFLNADDAATARNFLKRHGVLY